MNDLERQQKLDKLKKRMLEMSATIAEQEDEIALNERVLDIVLEDHSFQSPNETVQSFIEAMRKRAAASRKKDIEEKREGNCMSVCFTSFCGSMRMIQIAIIARIARASVAKDEERV